MEIPAGNPFFCQQLILSVGFSNSLKPTDRIMGGVEMEVEGR